MLQTQILPLTWSLTDCRSWRLRRPGDFTISMKIVFGLPLWSLSAVTAGKTCKGCFALKPNTLLTWCTNGGRSWRHPSRRPCDGSIRTTKEGVDQIVRRMATNVRYLFLAYLRAAWWLSQQAKFERVASPSMSKVLLTWSFTFACFADMRRSKPSANIKLKC